MTDSQTAALQLGLKVPDGRLLMFEVWSHDNIRAVKEKIAMKLRGVTFLDDTCKRTVELFTYGNGLMCTVDGVYWGQRTHDGVERIFRVEVEGRLIRFGGKGLGGVTMPRLATKEDQRKLLARVRDVLEDARATHNLPPPVSLAGTNSLVQYTSSVQEADKGRDVLLLNGVIASRYSDNGYTGYVHVKTCSGKCGGRCYPAGQGSKSWPSLMRGAAARGDAREVRRLLSAGTDPEATSSDAGMSALHFAARHGHREVVELLLAAGAYARLPNKAGHSPVDLARQHKHPSIVRLLEERGNPLGQSFPGQGRHRLAPGVSGSDADAAEWPTWLRRDLNKAHPKEMTDLESVPWAEGIEVQVRHGAQVEEWCREAKAGWSRPKQALLGKTAVITKVRRQPLGERSRHGVLLELLFDQKTNERYWFPSRAVSSDDPAVRTANEEEEAIRQAKATARGATADNITKWRVVFNGVMVRDADIVWETGIGDGDTVHLVKDNHGYLGMTGENPRQTGVSGAAQPSRPARRNPQAVASGGLIM